jgi:hypothetical protein
MHFGKDEQAHTFSWVQDFHLYFRKDCDKVDVSEYLRRRDIQLLGNQHLSSCVEAVELVGAQTLNNTNIGREIHLDCVPAGLNE